MTVDREATRADPDLGAPGALTEIEFRGSLVRKPLSIIMVVAAGILIAVIVGVLAGSGLLRGPTSPFVFVSVFLAVLVTIHLARRRGFSRKVQAVAERVGTDDPSVFVSAALKAVRGMQAGNGILEFIKLLVNRDQRGLTFRVGLPAQASPIQPLDVPFEPQPLNELTSALLRNERAAQRGETETDVGGISATDYVRRNVAIKGGWLLVMTFAVYWVWGAVDSIRKRYITPSFAWWSFFLFLILFIPPAARQRGQLLLVPGGAVWRRANWRQKNWRLHLFDRRSSALLVCRSWRSQWAVYVADEHETARAIATKTEIDFLLRAWLSPLSPPPVERLSDFQ